MYHQKRKFQFKNSDNFTIKQIIYPKKDSSLIAPGMCAKIKILFNPTSLNNFEDDIQILTEKFAFKVFTVIDDIGNVKSI
jgi:hypothetical protein